MFSSGVGVSYTCKKLFFLTEKKTATQTTNIWTCITGRNAHLLPLPSFRVARNC